MLDVAGENGDGALPSRATTPVCWRLMPGTPPDGAINNYKRVWMPTETTPQTRNTRQTCLLLHAARSENHHVWKGGFWLIVAALLEATGPLLGKLFH